MSVVDSYRRRFWDEGDAVGEARGKARATLRPMLVLLHARHGYYEVRYDTGEDPRAPYELVTVVRPEAPQPNAV